jgi:hypothetical protein
MAAPLRVVTVALCGALLALGLGLGSESQEEVFLEPDLEARDAANASGASGNLIVLTAFLTALAVAIAGATLSRRPPLRRLALALLLFGGAYLAVVVAQSAWPNYDAQLEARYARLANSLLASNADAVPSLVVPVLALALGAVLAVGAAARRLAGESAALASPERALQRQVAASLLAAPFLAVAALGSLRLLLGLPDDQPGLGPYLVVLPLAAIACLGLLVLALVKAWRLGSLVRNGRLAGAVQESWQALGRAEAAVAGVLAALALLAGLFEAAEVPGLDLGRVFAVTLRGHMQLLLLLAVPLAPLVWAHRSIAGFLATAPAHRATLETATDPLAAIAVAAAGASLGLAAITTWLADQALWTWLVALLPVAAVAVARCGPVRSAPHLLLLAYVLWAIGNTVVATYDGRQDGAVLVFRDAPGLLALWRTLGAAVAAVALARLALAAAPGEARSIEVPLAIGVGACLAAVALIEMPLSAWLLNRGEGEAIAVGSVMASLDLPVRVLLHSLSGLLAVGAALMAARLRRPDWFRPPPPPPLKATARAKSTRPPRPSARPTG